VEIARAKRFSELKFDYFKPPVVCIRRSLFTAQSLTSITTQAWLSATAACDLIIVASTCFYLLKSRSTGFQRSTDHIVFRIIKVGYAIRERCTQLNRECSGNGRDWRVLCHVCIGRPRPVRQIQWEQLPSGCMHRAFQGVFQQYYDCELVLPRPLFLFIFY
jgi:hypothetical protein